MCVSHMHVMCTHPHTCTPCLPCMHTHPHACTCTTVHTDSVHAQTQVCSHSLHMCKRTHTHIALPSARLHPWRLCSQGPGARTWQRVPLLTQLQSWGRSPHPEINSVFEDSPGGWVGRGEGGCAWQLVGEPLIVSRACGGLSF